MTFHHFPAICRTRRHFRCTLTNGLSIRLLLYPFIQQKRGLNDHLNENVIESSVFERMLTYRLSVPT